MNHDAADGYFEMTSGIERGLMDAQKIIEQLVSGLFVPFGVVHPKDCPKMGYGQELPEPPPGFVWYWVWYEKMQAEFYRSEYEKVICSACPFTKGVDAFYSNRGRNYPCKVASGTAGLINDKICGMVAWKDWTETHLFKRVAEKGKGALEKFKAKQAALKATA